MIRAPIFANSDGSISPCSGLRIEVARMALLCLRCSEIDLRLQATGRLSPHDVEHLLSEGYVLRFSEPITVDVPACVRDDGKTLEGENYG